MKEFIEKLIEEMQEIFCDGCTSCKVNQCDGVDKEECSWMIRIKDTVNQLAEEYAKDTYVQTIDVAELVEKKVHTKADRIRAMNDKELGEFLERFGTFNRPCSLAPGEPLKWLQSEVEG